MSSPSQGRIVVCRVGSERFTVPVAAVREVIDTPLVVAIPGAPPSIRGVVNVRGSLVTVVSGAILLDVKDAAAGEWLLVLAMFDGRVAIGVDEVEDLHSSGSAYQLPSLDVEAVVRPLIRPEAAKA
jgi:purine-binding chemotaxis protein CheW